MIPYRDKVLRDALRGVHPIMIMRRYALTDRELLAVLTARDVAVGAGLHGWRYWRDRMPDRLGVEYA